ncbi:efflux RND transporter periplasmic adaptor subunit [Pararoseomonas indoligenes]|uniref:Efflux RND transporter periplasmic adaptor subunit n=1 Tax=Roseomonas indoligenes TaxID=2820811 RepID=A0A940N076_9PROT|nr:efflux RND transporter periplasmic adaptor subunit [Pararoseomonas indoligenes]MBP0494280.1 efflux RND transporter periplasmic adaptor subunit [Pararoseomonas indoligenes]
MRPFFAALCCLLLASAPSLAQEAAPVSVAAAPAAVGPLPVEVTANGTAQPVSVISVRSRVDGQIERVHVQEGQMVKAGDLLFTLDSRNTQALLQQQEAILARDRAQLERAQSDARRYASLRSDAFASAQRAEQAQADATGLAATVRADEAQVAQTRLTLEFATIRAEASGRLGALPVKEGNFVRAAEGAVLATITQTDPINVAFSVPERWLVELREAQGRGERPRVRAGAPGDSGRPAEGELVFVDSSVDTATGTIGLKARFANAPARLWPGQYLEVVMVPRVEPQAVSVPVASVRVGQGGNFLYALTPENTARRVAVKVVRYAAGRAVIEGGVANGEMVVTEGIERLRDGARVAVRNPGGPPPARPQAEATPAEGSTGRQASAR